MRRDWEVVELADISMRVTEKNSQQIDTVFTVSAEHGLIEQEKFFNKRVASKNLIGYTIVRPGSLVYNKSYSANAPLGVITRNVHEYIGVVSPLYIVFKANEEKVLPRFLELATNSAMFHDSLKQFVKEGGRAHGGISVSLGDFFGSKLLLPTLTEQKRILDVVSSVDAYIDALQKQADSARAARNSVLQELLSAVGDDWSKTTLGEILERSIGGVWGSEPGTDQEDVLVVRSTEFTKSGYLNFHTGVKRSVKTSQLSSRELREGDILLEKSGGGPEQPVGRVVFVESDIPSKTVCSNFIQLLTPSIEFAVPRFIFFLMWMWHSQNKTLEYQAQTTGIRNLRTSDYLEQEVFLPPIAEQKRIVEIVSSMDEVIQSTEQAVVDAKVLRSGLLSDLLSGDHEISASYDSLLRAS